MSMDHTTTSDGSPNQAPLFLTAQDVARASDWPTAIQILRRAYGTEFSPKMVPPRTIARGPDVWLRTMPAISPAEGSLGCKLIAMNVRNRLAGYLIALFDPETIALRGLLDGNHITGIRTAATSAVAVDCLAPHRPLRVGILGAGFEARGHLTALAAIRSLAQVHVYSPTASRRRAFADEASAQTSLEVTAVDSPESAVRDTDVVICAARSKDETPILHGKWLSPGMTVVSIGSTVPEQREVDVEVVRSAALIVADAPAEVRDDTGDLLACRAAGIEVDERLVALTEVVGGRCPGRVSDSDIVLYKSVGSALQDIVVAEAVLARAEELGIGQRLITNIEPVLKR